MDSADLLEYTRVDIGQGNEVTGVVSQICREGGKTSIITEAILSMNQVIRTVKNICQVINFYLF